MTPALLLVFTCCGVNAQVFDVSVLDKTLAPEEVQCAVNAALYAHLVPGGAAPSTPVKPVPPPCYAHSTGKMQLVKRPRFM